MNLRQLWSPKTAQIVPILIGKINCNHFRGKLHTGCPCQRSDSHWERKLVTEDGQGGGRITVSKVAWFLSQVRVDVFTEQAAEALRGAAKGDHKRDVKRGGPTGPPRSF